MGERHKKRRSLTAPRKGIIIALTAVCVHAISVAYSEFESSGKMKLTDSCIFESDFLEILIERKDFIHLVHICRYAD